MMHRRQFLTATAAATAAAAFASPALAASAPVRNVVLVHGLFADGSCWADVIARLQAADYNVVAVQNPLTTLDASVDAVKRVLARMDGPTVLVAHSFAGTIISEVGVDPKVSSLVYVAARAPDAGEDYAALTRTFPAAPATAGIVFDGDQGHLTEEAFLRDFANGVPRARARVLYAVQEPFDRALTAARTTAAAWRSKPSSYAVGTRDRTIDPDLQRFMAKRMGARTVEIPAGHLAMVSHPDDVTAMIVEAAKTA